MQNATPIGPLTKISLSIDVLTIEPDSQPIRTGALFEFVYGIGTQGLSAFEKKLHGLEPGSRTKIRIANIDVQSYFEHLRGPLLDTLKIYPPFDMNIEVRSVSPTTDRELVHALADKNVDGCACNCGCGG